jgi:WS/DGAT/MGAT family acyltransferase
MIPVSSLDAGMLYVETEEMLMHTMGVLLVEPPDDVETSAMELVRDALEARLHLIPPFRRKLVQGPLKIGDPYWLEDPDFDLDKHVSHHVLPPPGGRRELDALIGELASGCLPRDKPLWELAVIEGLEDGKIAIVTKVHHATMDGGKGAALMGQLFSTEPHGEVPAPEEPWVPEPEPTTPWLMADTVRTLLGKPRRVATAATGVVSGLRGRGKKSDGSTKENKADTPGLFEAPSTTFNRALARDRAVGLCDVPLEDVKSIGRALGATVNDVVLAASCASVRSWLLSHGGLPDQPLVAVVPVSLRGEGDHSEGNRITVMRVRLPMEIEDPLERLRAVHAATQSGKKGSGGGGGGGALKHLADILTNISTPLVLAEILGRYSLVAERVPPLWNLVISNIAGSPVPLYFGGTRLRQLYPLGPVQHGSGLNITVLSTDGRLCFGALACKDLVPDVEDISSGFEEEIRRLKELVPN